MIILLANLYFAQTAAVFVSRNPVIPATTISKFTLSTTICIDERSIWDIVKSCLVTIFACTWVSVHPNIPAPYEPWWRMPLRRLELMVWALFAPELILAWAFRQWEGARRLRDRYGGLGWTTTHGHFLQMGGFMLIDHQGEKTILGPEKLSDLLNNGEIEFPDITEAEICDRSKSDGLGKAIAILQTFWFVAQFIARQAQGLDTTELELVTVALALLNGVIYCWWWDKPFNVKFPVVVRLLSEPRAPIQIPPFTAKSWSDAFSPIKTWFSGLPNMSVKGRSKRDVWDVVKNLPRTCLHALAFLFIVLFKRVGEMFDEKPLDNRATHVPTFYVFDPSDNAYVWLTLIGGVFGGIHCIGWNFVFPSRAELILWRVSSVIICAVPLVPFFVPFFVGVVAGIEKCGVTISDLIRAVVFMPILLLISLYIPARLYLLVEAVIALRVIPPQALTKVVWTSFLPHI